MKRRRKIAALVLAAGCIRQGRAPEEARRESSPEDFIGLTVEQRMEDFEFICEMLELYPIGEDLKRAQMADIDAVLASYRGTVERSRSDLDFLNDLGRMFKDLGNRGHLALYGAEEYASTLELYEMQGNDVKVQILGNEKSRATYGQVETSPDTGLFALRQAAGEKRSGGSGSRREVKLEKLDESTAYIRIYSFNGLYMEEDGPKVARFIEECAGMDDLIIDIRGNGGGNANYWRNYIVAPNIAEGMHARICYLYDEALLNSAAARGQLLAEHPDIREITRPIAELPPYKNLSAAARRFDYFAEGVDRVDPAPGGHLFTGRVWLLVDGGTGSASEMLASFCLQTGFATTVGERTAGANCFGNPYLFALPHSGLVFRFDPFYGLNPDGTCNNIHGVTPQLPCASKDALDVCLREIRK